MTFPMHFYNAKKDLICLFYRRTILLTNSLVMCGLAVDSYSALPSGSEERSAVKKPCVRNTHVEHSQFLLLPNIPCLVGTRRN